MTILTMIWNDSGCSGVSDHHWHTMEFSETREVLKELGDWEVCERMVTDFYKTRPEGTPAPAAEAAEFAKEALEDIGMVGIFIGVPEEL